MHRRLLPTLAMLILVRPAPAQPSAPDASQDNGQPASLAVDDFEQMALQNNPTLAVAAARLDASRGRWYQVGLRPNPKLGYLGTEVGNDGRGGQQGGLIGQQFIRGNKLQLNREIEARDIARLEQEFAAQRMRVLTDVRMGFQRVLLAQTQLDLAQRLMEIGWRAVETTQQLLDAQEGRKTDVLQARIEFEQAQNGVATARGNYIKTWQQLASVVGMPELPQRPVDGGDLNLPPLVGWEAALAQVIGGSPEIAAAYAEIEKAKWSVRRAKAEVVPDVNAEAALQYDNASEYAIAQILVDFNLPIRNRNQGGIRAALAELTAAENRATAVRLRLRQQLADVYAQYRIAYEQAQRFRTQILPRAQETLDLATVGFRAGELAFLDLLTAQRSYFQANISYLEALGIVRIRGEQIRGLLLDDALAIR